MKKENIKYIVIAAVCILALLAIYFYMRYQGLKSEIAGNAGNAQNTGSSTGGSSSTTTGTTTTPVIPPYHGTDKTKWKVDDTLTILSGTVNVYKTASASAYNIQESVNIKDKPFATVLSPVNAQGYVFVKYISFNFIGYSSIETGYIFPTTNITN